MAPNTNLRRIDGHSTKLFDGTFAAGRLNFVKENLTASELYLRFIFKLKMILSCESASDRFFLPNSFFFFLPISVKGYAKMAINRFLR